MRTMLALSSVLGVVATARAAPNPSGAPSPDRRFGEPYVFDSIGALHRVFAGEDRPGWRHGGPVLAFVTAEPVGARMSSRLRFGYEIARPHWLVYSIGVESDATTHLVSAGVEAVMPLLPIAPHGPQLIGYGAGLELLATSTGRVGARGSLTTYFAGTLGVGVCLEVYPTGDPGERHNVTMRVRVSL